MNYIISLFIGAVTSVMILLNGTLSNALGNFSSSILIHITGFISIILVAVFTKSKLRLKGNIPVYLYSAGFIGVATVVFTNLSFSNLGVSLTQALGLLGQTVFSILIDSFGLFGMKKIRFNTKKSIGLIFIALGITVMTFY